MKKIFVIITIWTCVLLENISCTYLWLDHYTLREIPQNPREKIQQKYDKLCKQYATKSHRKVNLADMIKSSSDSILLSKSSCHVLKELLSETFTALLSRRGPELVDFWNNKAVKVLRQIFKQKAFPYLRIDDKVEDLLLLFESIDDDSLREIKLRLSKLAFTSMLFEHESSKKPNDYKLKRLSSLTLKFIRIIEKHTGDVRSSRNWKILELKDPSTSPLYDHIALLKDFVKNFKDDDRYKEMVTTINNFHQGLHKIQGAYLKKELVYVIDSYLLIIRMFFDALLMKEFKKIGSHLWYENKITRLKIDFRRENPVTYEWVDEPLHPFFPPPTTPSASRQQSHQSFDVPSQRNLLESGGSTSSSREMFKNEKKMDDTRDSNQKNIAKMKSERNYEYGECSGSEMNKEERKNMRSERSDGEKKENSVTAEINNGKNMIDKSEGKIFNAKNGKTEKNKGKMNDFTKSEKNREYNSESNANKTNKKILQHINEEHQDFTGFEIIGKNRKNFILVNRNEKTKN